MNLHNFARQFPLKFQNLIKFLTNNFTYTFAMRKKTSINKNINKIK